MELVDCKQRARRRVGVPGFEDIFCKRQHSCQTDTCDLRRRERHTGRHAAGDRAGPALKYNPHLIYEYVHDNVQTLAEYGSMKGPLGPILDGNGTVFDQAELMQQLLLASEASNSAIANPQIAVGQVTVTAAQLTSWLGTSSAASMETILNAGGFPATYSVKR